MKALNAEVIAVLFFLFGLIGAMDMQDQIASDEEARLQRENIALRVQAACARSLSCDGIPESFKTVASK
jgi:Tfp pilus assembly protein PilV